MSKVPVKEQVEIQEKPKIPQQEAMAKLLSMMEKPVQPPPIEETLDKVKQAIQAAKVKPKPQRMTWYCTDCGGAHIQIDGTGMGLGHISVDVLDGKFVDQAGLPLTGKLLELMTDYAVPKVQGGEGHSAIANRQTLAKMKEKV